MNNVGWKKERKKERKNYGKKFEERKKPEGKNQDKMWKISVKEIKRLRQKRDQ